MLNLRVSRRSITLAVVALALIAAGIAYAAIPGADGVITACRDMKTGVLRALDAEAGGACSAKEAVLTWNHTGPRGLQGERGPAGTADAYARIAGDGTVNAEFSKGITSANVTHPATGVYCLHDLGFLPRVAVANGGTGIRLEAGSLVPSNFGAVVSVTTFDTSSGNLLGICNDGTEPPSTWATVRIYVASTGADGSPAGLVDRGFSILLDD